MGLKIGPDRRREAACRLRSGQRLDALSGAVVNDRARQVALPGGVKRINEHFRVGALF